MQDLPSDPEHIMAGACCKHYIGNTVEGTTEIDGEHHDRAHMQVLLLSRLVGLYLLNLPCADKDDTVESRKCHP